jgi:hypothetical protein
MCLPVFPVPGKQSCASPLWPVKMPRSLLPAINKSKRCGLSRDSWHLRNIHYIPHALEYKNIFPVVQGGKIWSRRAATQLGCAWTALLQFPCHILTHSRCPGVNMSIWEHLRTLFAKTLHGAAKWRWKASLLFCKLHCFLENGWLSKLTVYRCIFSILQFWHVREPLPPCCDSPWRRFLAWRYVQGCLLPVWYIVLSVMSAGDEAYIGRNPLARGKERENLQDVLTRFEAQQRRQKRCLATIGGCCGVTVSFPSMPKLWQCISRVSCALTCSILSCWLYPVTMLSNMYHAKMTDLKGLINVHNMERCPVPTCPTCDAPFGVQTVQCLCFVRFSWVFFWTSLNDERHLVQDTIWNRFHIIMIWWSFAEFMNAHECRIT